MFKNAFVRQVTDTTVEVQCPFCKHDNVHTRVRTHEGLYIKTCEVCGNKYRFIVDKEEIFRGGEIGGC